MHLESFVRVLPGDDASAPGGTGYLISADRILTAGHVLGPGSSVKIEVDFENQVARLEGEVIWRGREPCDAALVRLVRPLSTAPPVAHLAETPLGTEAEWESRGWAAAAPEEPLVRDSMVPLSGKAQAFQSAEKRIKLTVSQEPESSKLWQGISGAPVFQQGGSRRLLGVVSEVPEGFDNVLWAVPLTLLLAQESFLEALGPEIAKRRRARLVAEVERWLKSPKEPSTVAIADRKVEWRERLDKGGVAALAKELVTAADVLDVLSELNGAHEALCADIEATSAMVNRIEQIVFCAVPLLLLRGLLHATPDLPGAVVLALPVATPTMAELLLSGLGGRPSQLEAVRDDYPVGRGRIPLLPELGLDFDDTKVVRAYATHFEKELLTSQDRELLRRVWDSKPEKAIDTIFELVNDEFAFDAEKGNPRLRRYLFYDSQFAEDNKAALRVLRTRLRTVHQVEGTGGDHVMERKIGRFLRAIIDRSQGPSR